MKKFSTTLLLCLLIFLTTATSAEEKPKADSLKNISLSGLSFRGVGPAVTGGRIRDLAVNPDDHKEFFIGSGHGNLWKTTNNGVTFSPVFDNQNSYTIGVVRYDPKNTNVIWVGTGESSNHANSAYGDGIYKSEDGGKSWKNMGIKESEHIGGIAIDPNDPNIVYAAAMGPLRREGGDRGIFKTTDGGKTWENVLKINEYTGCYQVHMDPRYSNILYAVAHQRMRKLYTGVWGGPETALYRSTDSGANWEKMTNGLPSEDMGRIGFTVSPVNPDVLYAIIENQDQKGFYRSQDRGASWEKMSSYVSSYPFYFQKLYADPIEVNRVYSMDVFLQVSDDGGKTWKNLGEDKKHVDNHCMWIDPDDNRHLIVGCDGGMYQSYDKGDNWLFMNNIPIAEIYKITADNAKPFYNVFIGTQDNNSLGGPSRTIKSSGINNSDWTFTVAGDGFQTQVDWKNPNIIYAESQNGGLVRFDKASGERLYIQPQDFADTAYRFDWDTPLLISQHNNERLFFGGNKLLMTNDMGSTWEEISPDLTRGVPKEMLRLMGQSWSKDDMVSKGKMGVITSIAESPIDQNILFAGSGDGLIHYTTDLGKTWTKSQLPKGFPEYARVHDMAASYQDKNVAYAAAHNFVDGDYKPYALKTTDGGKTWKYINGNLPERGSAYTIAVDYMDPNLLFVGTQFGVYFSNNGGSEWIRLKAGIPQHCSMSLTIQKDEDDLVVSTFGRGIYILDDYSPLRFMNEETLSKDAYIFPIDEALMFIPSDPFGFKGVGFMGAGYYSAPNPPVGATFTYFIKDEVKSLKEKRNEKEKEIKKEGGDIKFPDYNTLRAESEEPDPYLLFTVTDEAGNVVRKIKTGITKGVNRIVWDFRYDKPQPISMEPFDDSIPWNDPDRGFLAPPGKYKVLLSKFVDGKFTQLVEPQEFICKPLGNATLPAKDIAAQDAFNQKAAELIKAVYGLDEYRGELNKKLSYLKKAVFETPDLPNDTYNNILAIELDLQDFNRELNGDGLKRFYESGVPTSVKGRVDYIIYSSYYSTSAPTTTAQKSYDAAAEQFDNLSAELKKIASDIAAIETTLDKYGAPYTPGRFPELK